MLFPPFPLFFEIAFVDPPGVFPPPPLPLLPPPPLLPPLILDDPLDDPLVELLVELLEAPGPAPVEEEEEEDDEEDEEDGDEDDDDDLGVDDLLLDGLLVVDGFFPPKAFPSPAIFASWFNVPTASTCFDGARDELLFRSRKWSFLRAAWAAFSAIFLFASSSSMSARRRLAFRSTRSARSVSSPSIDTL